MPYSPSASRLWSFSKVGLAGDRVAIVETTEEIGLQLQRWQRAHVIQSPKGGQLVAASLLAQAQGHTPLTDVLRHRYSHRWYLMADLLAGLPADQVKVVEWSGGPFIFAHLPGMRSDEVFHELLKRGIGVCPSSVFTTGEDVFPGIRISIGSPGPVDDPSQESDQALALAGTALVTALRDVL